jgi:hypothetical protein
VARDRFNKIIVDRFGVGRVCIMVLNYCTRLTMFLHSLTARLRSCLSCGSRATATLHQFYVRNFTSLPCASVDSLCFLTDEGLSQVGVAARENTEPVRDVLCKPLPCRFSTFLSSQVVWALNKASTLLNPTVCSGLVWFVDFIGRTCASFQNYLPSWFGGGQTPAFHDEE